MLQAAAGNALSGAPQQVAAALTSLASSAPAAVTNSGDSTTASAAPDTARTVRTTADGGREIVVKLDPEHLGSVAIRLRMTGGTVDVSITVSNAGTLGALDRDRHLLTAALASAGLSSDAMTLTSGSTDVAGAPSNSTQAGGQNGSGQPQGGGFAATSDNPTGAGGRRRDGTAPAGIGPDGSAVEGSEPEQVRAGGLYV